MSFHKVFEVNERGVDYVAGDIHGMYSELMAALNEWGFNKDVDRLFSVGDLVDRGPDNEKVLGLLNEVWFLPVTGNHEELMINGLAGFKTDLWVMNGGSWAFWDEEQLPALYELVEPVKELPYAITVKHKSGHTFGICHAEPPVDDWADIESVADDEYLKQKMVWGRDVIKGLPVHTKNISMTIHGHTPVEEVKSHGNALFIDLGCFFSKKIEVVSLDQLASGVNQQLLNKEG